VDKYGKSNIMVNKFAKVYMADDMANSGTNMAEAYMEENPQRCILAVIRRPQQGNRYTQDMEQFYMAIWQIEIEKIYCNNYSIVYSNQYKI